MKRTLLTFGAAALVLTGTALAGHHEDGKKMHEGEKMSLEDKFAMVDTDGNGVITEAEFTAQGERATAEKFVKMSGGDGELTMAEVKAHYEMKKAMHKDKMHEKHGDHEDKKSE